MSAYQAEKAAKQMILSGYRHHSYEDEKRLMTGFFEGNGSIDEDTGLYIQSVKNLYADVLGPQRMRSIKNSCICMITIVCRAAIDYGIDQELSFALSDYYINEVERQTEEYQMMKLQERILNHYSELVREKRKHRYTPAIMQAIQYIDQNIYTICTVAAAASYVKVTPNYLCKLFQQEVGLSPSAFIRKKKMAEAENMLRHLGYSVTETSDALGYYDVAYFSKVYKKYYGQSPRKSAASQF